MPLKPIYYCLTMDYPPMKGGVARYLWSLAKASEGQMQVFTPDDISFWWSGWPKWLPLIKRCLERKDGVIFVSHVVPIGTAAWLANLLGGPSYIVLFHGTDLQRMKTGWKRWLLRRICSRADKLVTNSQATAKALKALVPRSDALVLTPGVEFNDFQTSRIEARRRLDVPDQTSVILTVCRLVERKGTDVLIQAVAQLQEARPGTRLVVVGSGPYAPQLHQLAELMKVNVMWVGGATDEQVRDWYAAADIFCLPAREESDDVEGFGIVFLEAAAAGLPVVAGRGWGTEEAVMDGVTGLLVQPSVGPVTDALLKLLNDGPLRNRLGEAGRARAAKDFKWADRWQKLTGEAPSQKPLEDIAVVIPCLNHAKELEKTLAALARQTIRPKEIVVVDNGSNDDPGSVVKAFERKLPVRYVYFNERSGAPAARNQGARLTTAPFLLFLDADAELVPHALEVMRRTLEQHPEAAFAYSDFYWGPKLFRGKPWDPKALQQMNWIHTSSLIRRSEFVSFDEALNKFQDWDLWLTMAEQNKSGVWIDEPLFRVTERKTGYSRWLPSFMHKIHWPILGWTPPEIVRYRKAEKIIRQKHKI